MATLDLEAIRAQMISGVGRQVMAPIIRNLLAEVERLRGQVARVEALCGDFLSYPEGTDPHAAGRWLRAALAEPEGGTDE